MIGVKLYDNLLVDIYLGGATYSYCANESDVNLRKIDESGNLLRQKTFGESSSDYANSICVASGRVYVITGYTYLYGTGNSDVYILKTEENGETPSMLPKGESG